MKLTLEKRTTDCTVENTNCTNFRKIKKELGRQNRIELEYINFLPQPNQNLKTFFEPFIRSGDEVLTVGPTNENIYRAITSCNASYFEFYEKPLFLPDSLSIISKVSMHTKLIILGNPNRFTGVVYSEKEIEDILNTSENTIVVLDESAYESSQITAIDLIKKYDNLLLIRLFENRNNFHINYIISNPIVIEKIEKDRLDFSYFDTDLSAILNKMKKTGNRLGRIKDTRQEMLYLAIRLRMFGLGCFLNPDYSLVINSTDSEKIIFSLNKIGIQGLDLACYPGLDGNILLQFSLDINAMSIIEVFETISNDKNNYKFGRNRLETFRSPELDNEFKIEKNRETVSENRTENYMVF